MTDNVLNPTELTQIEVGASEDSWGDKLNANAATVNGWFDAGPALKLEHGGTGAATASNARANLGLGTMATQAAGAVAVTGGSIAGITDLAVADGGTGASSAAAARSNLGAAALGANSDITSLSGLGTPLSAAQGGTGRADAKAPSLVTGRTISVAGDVSWGVTFDGSANVAGESTLANVNSNVGTFGSSTVIPIVTVNAKGLVTAVATAATSPDSCVQLGGGGVSGLGSVAVTNIDAKYSRIAVVSAHASVNTSAGIVVEYSTDNGSSWNAVIASGNETSATDFEGRIHLLNVNTAAGPVVWGDLALDGGSGSRKAFVIYPSAAINALRARPSVGTFDGGAVYFLAF